MPAVDAFVPDAISLQQMLISPYLPFFPCKALELSNRRSFNFLNRTLQA